ncbi:hypothetical protein GCM10010483_61770 [Actinokineospora diospyrosa]
MNPSGGRLGFAIGAGGRLAFGIATRDRTASSPGGDLGARSAIFELCSMRWTCFARGPYDTRRRTAKQGPKDWPCRAETLRVPSPHTKQVHPIEHLAPASPTVQALGWQGSRERAEMAPAVPSVHALGKWAGADLTGGAGWHRRVRVFRGWHCGLRRT